MFNENEREGIKAEAQALLKRFGDKLSGINLSEKVMDSKDSGMRRAGVSTSTDSSFREKIFSNAPQREGDFIIAERKKW